MAAVYGIIMNHDGWISIDSELDKGTVVRIYLPAVTIRDVEVEKPEIEPAKIAGRILVIEDEKIVTDVILAMLERLGYHALSAVSGAEGINIAETFKGDIDLALLDIRLPDMDGGGVYHRLKAYKPDLKVIVCSGYAIDGPAQEILDAGAEGFIQKPFTLNTLSEKIKEVLEG